MLSIIIVNYKSEKYLEKCLSSVAEKIPSLNCEIIVVNNGSNLNIALPKNINCVNTGKNRGFGTACNLGAKIAKGEFILFLNPDTEIVSENISELLNRLAEDKKIAVIGPKLIKEKGEVQEWCAGKEFSFWRLFKNNLGIIDSKKIWKSQKEILADWVSGAAFFVKKEIFNKAGGFDRNFFMYFEDDDLCKRIRKLGYDVLYYPNFAVLHKGGKSWDNSLKQKMHFFRSMLAYARKKS